MNKIEISGKAWNLIDENDGSCVFELEFHKNRVVNVGCIGEVAEKLIGNFKDEMTVTVIGELSSSRDDLFYSLDDENPGDNLYIKANDIIFEDTD